MTVPAPETGQQFWRGVLLAGGSTTVPRWTLDPRPGTARHETLLPGSLVTALRRLAADLEVPVRSVLLAAHARVLAALSGETDVVTGYLAGGGSGPLPCRLSTDAGSWRELVRHAAAVEAGLQAHRDVALDELRSELGVPGPTSEVVVGPAGDQDLPGDAVLGVGFPGDGARLALRYRKDVLDAGAAARICGYHRTALSQVVADPDADPLRQSLLAPAELRHQLDGMAGRSRDLPDRRAHELFEEQAGHRPDAVAAVHGDRQLTYGELNSRANRLARALRARGLLSEDVVAVVTERDLDWLTAVLAVFKAGGVYLPIEPHFPADRIATTIARAGCRLVLTEPGSTASLDAALTGLPGVAALDIRAAVAEGHSDRDLGLAIAPDQLAYIYFTSGSTGEPKGAMCEHAGMLNHLFAKIDDLGIGEGQVVAQVAPQCFDISLWQLVSALLVGGRTLLVPQDVVLDAQRFVDLLVDGRVAVVQVVPSYLEVVLSYLEVHPRELPDLRCVSVTGEALKKELTQRWFAAEPGIALVNAYGLTETSDDTNHEVMHGVPDGDRVPLGGPVANVEVRVVDEQLAPVPLGAPGEIVFSGVCVGRGYVNDPDRTRLAFVPDPYRPGRRLYRSGDHGFWRPDGKLEFLGRRDSQVKISGFRIEIGEIENTLLRIPGVRDGAVVVAEAADRSRHLVAFYTGDRAVEADVLRTRLAASLPAYMVPRAFHWRARLPLTANSKIDKKALTALARELDVVETSADAPSTPTEQRVAAAWAAVLGIPQDQIARRDSFFDRGGTSLSAVKLAIALDRAVSLTDLIDHPVLADLAELVARRAQERDVAPAVPGPRGAPAATPAPAGTR
ncbi:non-ribosomal peptide synthetase [Geodermatophilus sabuli]|uniref:Amino acid adenylation domain-containing protein n=1 Tax=Geodermatophilus sabuli TaxID=1564158 RepID=A0A285EB08_9ACTN|nr:amino acid adenylation domain-containing protein [Geodermatophilus sabuli]MBB3081876.1 amino acid adenylation domain-containing protein [Geodermatophilus sabuli]SNX95251.1 amino acid adenylation domain-containing protein [Geodermatophilus sabuli]